MKARTRTAVAPLALLALLALAMAVGYLVERRADEAQARRDEEARLLRFAADDVQALSITARGEVVRVARSPGGWRLEAPVAAAADGAVVNGLLEALAALRRSSSLEATGDLGRFGLAAPRVRIALELSGGRAEALALGDPIALDGGAYARAGDGPVAVLTRDPGPALDRGVLELREKRLLGPGAEPRRIEVRGGVGAYTLERRGARWWIAAPLVEPADEGKAERVATALRALTATGFARATRPDAEYGLDRPLRDVRVSLADREVHLQLGAPRVAAGAEKPAYLWARRDGDPELASVLAEAFEALDEPVEALRDHAVLAFDVARVARVQVGAMALERRAGAAGWALTAPRTGPARHEAMDALLSALSGLYAVRIAGDGDAVARANGLSPPARTVELFDAGGASIARLEVGRVVEDGVAVRPGGSARVFVVSAGVEAAIPASAEAVATEGAKASP